MVADLQRSGFDAGISQLAPQLGKRGFERLGGELRLGNGVEVEAPVAECDLELHGPKLGGPQLERQAVGAVGEAAHLS